MNFTWLNDNLSFKKTWGWDEKTPQDFFESE